ncbi:MAG: hypothetical protein EOM21_19395 [Gammaproteobacteria bacterium]|nr:hypothetical protein [Gammaproteobacteria bacterium]
MATGSTQGNAKGVYVVKISFTPAEVATITTAEQDVTVPGVNVGDAVTVSPPGHEAGVVAAAARVTAANTVGITFVNPTAGGVTPTAGDYIFTITRPENGVAAARVAD